MTHVFETQCKCWWDTSTAVWQLLNKTFGYIRKKEYSKYLKYNNTCHSIVMSFVDMIDDNEKLLKHINDCLKPKKAEQKKNGEVFTKLSVVKKMIKKLMEQYRKRYHINMFKNKHLKIYDPACGIGNFQVTLYRAFMVGLKNVIKDKEERKRHILENMLYMSELNPKNCVAFKKIFDIKNKYKMNLYEGDSLNVDIKSTFGVDKFDIIIGNPPYNKALTNVGAVPLYNKFIEYYIDKCDLLTFIVPSRWFAGGKGLDNFRHMMLNRTDIVYIKHFDDASTIFKGVDIKGGVNYFLIDKSHNGLCDYNGSQLKLNTFDILVDSKYYELINKLIKYECISKNYISQDHYKLQTNDKRLKEDISDDRLKCFVSQQKGFVKYIDKEEVKKNADTYKVITTRASFKANSGFGNTFIGKPNDVHTKSYISFNLETEDESKSLLSYMNCKLPNFMLSLRKISQDISTSTCKWIPLPPLDREWTNDDIYKHFELTREEIELIKNTNVIGYKD